MLVITINGVDYDVPSSAADTNWAAAQVAFEQALAAGVNTAIAGEYQRGTWTAVSFNMGWSGTLQYREDSVGTGWLRGTATKAGDPTASAICTLPGAPPADSTFSIPNGAAATAAEVVTSATVQSNGVLSVTKGTADGVFDFGQVFFATEV